jgi:hypothetical protein
MLSIIYAECQKQTHYADYRIVQCLYDVCHYAERRGTNKKVTHLYLLL